MALQGWPLPVQAEASQYGSNSKGKGSAVWLFKGALKVTSGTEAVLLLTFDISEIASCSFYLQVPRRELPGLGMNGARTILGLPAGSCCALLLFFYPVSGFRPQNLTVAWQEGPGTSSLMALEAVRAVNVQCVGLRILAVAGIPYVQLMG